MSSKANRNAKAMTQHTRMACINIDNEDKFKSISSGFIMYVSFLKDATDKVLPKLVKLINSTKLDKDPETGYACSLNEAGGDLLVIPQACLAGKAKGRGMQYHDQVDKDEGRPLYYELILALAKTMVGDAKGTSSSSASASADDDDSPSVTETYTERDLTDSKGGMGGDFDSERMYQTILGVTADTLNEMTWEQIAQCNKIVFANGRQFAWGTYGNEQGFAMDTPSLYAHFFEF